MDAGFADAVAVMDAGSADTDGAIEAASDAQPLCIRCGDAGCGYIAERAQWICCNSHDDPNPNGWCCMGYRELFAMGCPASPLQFYQCIGGTPPCPDAGGDAAE
jgi:hypothetical protein